MSHIKGTKALNKAVSANLAPFGIAKAVLSNTYSYLWEKEIVTFTVFESEFEDEWFKEFIYERFGYAVNEYGFIISLLHEVGHHNTYDDIDVSTINFCSDEKARISREMEDAEDESVAKALEWQYFNLPDEIVATEWAVNFAKENPEVIKEMWDTLKQELLKFYKKNDLTEQSKPWYNKYMKER